jgi:hypothetical protein
MRLTAYVNPPGRLSLAMERVARALAYHAPSTVEITDEEDAEIVVLHVIGMEGLHKRIAELRGRKYGIIQYCLSSTHTKIEEWYPIWNEAEIVWSYYDIPCYPSHQCWNYYHAPLGIDPAFAEAPVHSPKKYVVATSGYVAGMQEAIDFCYKAAEVLQRKVFHLGPSPVGMPAVYDNLWDSKHGISDAELACLYSHCDFVSGLRWTEGFELPVIEGAACGARPICFDLPVYRQWFDGLATFVPHDRNRLQAALVDVMKNPNPLTIDEQKSVIKKFDWKPIVEGFWERVL